MSGPVHTGEGQKVTKKFLSEHTDGLVVDLSLCFLQEIPVNELTRASNFNRLDLSQNKITEVPSSFSSLAFLIEIDFSKNNISSLPENFGDLQKLQKLDLYGNALITLPYSFSSLSRLKWLDLRDNPLREDIAKAAGDCTNEKECKDCAKKVVRLISQLQRAHEEQIEAERKELEARQHKKEKAQQRKKRIAKKLKEEQKEKRRAAWMERKETEELENQEDEETQDTTKEIMQSKQRGFKRWGCLLCITVSILASGASAWLYQLRNEQL
ncbi:PREDICTED: leucine-rich repeat-containing protein 59-like [Amphimedon queenslandica]|uniref:Leucine-rich repeat-containing protein 59 n=1 Tax=Amphimedon queenslandica TaxID=400682 RepID=A0A1X7UD61_AMPQE|nr:PREDICTED: leucine-rich repeat-containing protein 59-like [Amphimedon queenslandica]|eukprot:XP_003388344.1 PREDICTED: leucine-rich repeat-containing protein 59-like [Amphimedon queenslandica]